MLNGCTAASAHTIAEEVVKALDERENGRSAERLRRLRASMENRRAAIRAILEKNPSPAMAGNRGSSLVRLQEEERRLAEWLRL